MSLQSQGCREHIRNDLDIILARIVLAAAEELGEGANGGGEPADTRPPTRAELARSLARKPQRGAERTPPTVAGILDRFRYDDVRCMIEALEERGLLEETPGNRIVVTIRGRSYLRGHITAPMGIVDGVLARPEERAEVYVALRRVRYELAREHGLPAYQVFHDRSLRMLAARRPRTIDELLKVPGIGAARAARFGPAVLACLEQIPPAPAPTTPQTSPPELPRPEEAAQRDLILTASSVEERPVRWVGAA